MLAPVNCSVKAGEGFQVQQFHAINLGRAGQFFLTAQQMKAVQSELEVSAAWLSVRECTDPLDHLQTVVSLLLIEALIAAFQTARLDAERVDREAVRSGLVPFSTTVTDDSAQSSGQTHGEV